MRLVTPCRRTSPRSPVGNPTEQIDDEGRQEPVTTVLHGDKYDVVPSRKQVHFRSTEPIDGIRRAHHRRRSPRVHRYLTPCLLAAHGRPARGGGQPRCSTADANAVSNDDSTARLARCAWRAGTWCRSSSAVERYGCGG